MAGHSKWANIQHRKKAVDAKRGKIFTRVNRELTVAAREGGGDPDANPRLRLAMQKANAANMPKDTIDRTIKKATGELEGVTYEEVRYEGYAVGGVAVMVDCLTDNRNRTVAAVRHAFSKHGGNLGTDGSVAYLFNKIGVLNFPPGTPEEAIMEIALEAYDNVLAAMEAGGHEPANSEITMRASTEVELDADSGRKVLRLLDVLEDLDDTQDVYSNADIPDEAYED